MRLRKSFLRRNRIAEDCVVAYETGSQDGLRLVRWAPMFEQVHTIEVDPEMYAVARERLACHPHVKCYLGSSPEVLDRIIVPTAPSFFFLDAHIVAQPKESGYSGTQCVLREELSVIFSKRWVVPPEILIDDAKFFAPRGRFWMKNELIGWGFDRDQYPLESEIVSTATQYDKKYRLTPVGRALMLSTTWKKELCKQ